jgi:hypothetical protein
MVDLIAGRTHMASVWSKPSVPEVSDAGVTMPISQGKQHEMGR